MKRTAVGSGARRPDSVGGCRKREAEKKEGGRKENAEGDAEKFSVFVGAEPSAGE